MTRTETVAATTAPRIPGTAWAATLGLWFLAFFFLSGFVSLVDEVVWLRLAMAAFGVTAPLVSVVLSVFMGGLALGSFGAGRWLRGVGVERAGDALSAYAVAEVVIGLSAFVVPPGLGLGREWMVHAGAGVSWGSTMHYLLSSTCITIVLLPFTTAMGATFPLAMAALQGIAREATHRSFSFLYAANVLGAALGTLVAAMFLIEWLGFRGTLLAVASINAALAIAAFALSGRSGAPAADEALRAEEASRAAKATDRVGAKRPKSKGEGRAQARGAGGADRSSGPIPMRDAVSEASIAPAPRVLLVLLFATGFASMAMEVVWVREYTPILGTVVYSFASILAVYLFASFLGASLYRRWSRTRPAAAADAAWLPVWVIAAALALLPLAAVDPRFRSPDLPLDALLRVALGLAPFCAAVGFVTPMLVDRWSAGAPERAGRAYAINVVGCILGPLIAGFVMLPSLGERGSLVTLAIGLFATAALAMRAFTKRSAPRNLVIVWAGSLVVAASLAWLTRDFETLFPRREIRRDYEATVIATGEERDRQLLVNGVGMTNLTPITKMMVHLPLALRTSPPRKTLVVCFGMGTTFRAALSWGVPCTAVDLIPSVPAFFGYYHADAAAVARRPGASILVDDGRRFLARTRERFDLITVDPPPPAEAATSSLLYSREFCELARARLAPGGILAVWFPGGEPAILSAIVKALTATFPHVRAFQSIEGWGFHLLASESPIESASPEALAARLPAQAAADLVEWGPWKSPAEFFRAVLERELPIARLAQLAPGTPTLTDDRPVNEYFLVRRWMGSGGRR
jgi:spermidine synthase